jgi:broad specificity phosphatase PhoE
MIVLVRHGQTAANASGLLLGRADPPLTELGHRQAEAVARVVTSPAAVISSPLLRARQTAAAFGLPVTVDERWAELDYGEYDGRPFDAVPAEEWDRWRHDAHFAPPGGESLADLGRRVRSVCADLAATPAAASTSEQVVVVSHVSPVKAAVAWALDAGDELAWRLYCAVASISRVAVTERGPVLHSYNETAHLDGVER